LALIAVKLNGYALKHLDNSLRSDKEVVLAAAKTKNWAIVYADPSLELDNNDMRGIISK